MVSDRIEKAELTNMCMVYDGAGNVLVQDRVGKTWSGITFPGGHVEQGEDFTDAVIREVQEETGLHISHPQLCGIKQYVKEDDTRYIVFCYKTKHFKGKLHGSKEGEVKWVQIEEIRHMQLPISMDDMLQLFLNESISEQSLHKENGKWKSILK